ncbi:MAG: penicillin-binding transpeptidase domain-containing protein [Bacteroidia bacterium]|nr:penicillin-binding transpeptidase domain-containing protein [Bacteroidia bacterium]
MDLYSKRKYLIIGLFSLVSLIIVIRLFYIQVIDSSYKISAASNVLRREINYPARGVIFDRNGKLLVYNQAAYDVLITPRELKSFDTLSFCHLVGVDKAELISEINKAKSYSRFKPSPIIKQLSSQMYAVLQEQLFKYPGFFIQARTLRQYPSKIAAHVLGYVGEVDQKIIDGNPYYENGDYIGRSGIERAYEDQLRGIKGISYKMVDVHQIVKGSFENGRLDTAAVIGKNLVSTLNADLQAYGERLLSGKVGSIVAIEPSTGEILVLASSPTFDPGLFVGRERSRNYAKLLSDPYKPMLNRAITSSYPPGSTFKLANALIGLQDGLLQSVRYSCAGKGSSPIKCTHNHETPLPLISAIRESCNSFFWQSFKSEINHYATPADGLDAFRKSLLEMGLGKKIGGDLFSETSGSVPSVAYYNKYYGAGGWNSLTIRSLSIGQGELLVTPLQLSNMVSLIANRGYYIAPHLVRGIQENNVALDTLHFEKHVFAAGAANYEMIVDGMEQVVEKGTGRTTAKLDSLTVCGKTGTIQNPHGEAHSAFVAFSPKINPKIAIAVYIENGVWGAKYAAPIASLIIEKYLKGKIAPNRQHFEDAMINSDLISTMNIEHGD